MTSVPRQHILSTALIYLIYLIYIYKAYWREVEPTGESRHFAFSCTLNNYNRSLLPNILSDLICLTEAKSRKFVIFRSSEIYSKN